MATTRRTVLRSAAIGAVTVPLAACGDGAEPDGTRSVGPSPSATGDTRSATPSATTSESPSRQPHPEPEPLAQTGDVAVGGAVFVDAQDVPGTAVPNGIVVTQPRRGECHAFSRDCSHRHCAVSDLRDGNIHCFCHGSLYDPSTGANIAGPAPSPLKRVPIRVRHGAVFRA